MPIRLEGEEVVLSLPVKGLQSYHRNGKSIEHIQDEPYIRLCIEVVRHFGMVCDIYTYNEL